MITMKNVQLILISGFALSSVQLHAQDVAEIENAVTSETEKKLERVITDEKEKPGAEVGEASYNIEDCRALLEQSESDVSEKSEADEVLPFDLDKCREIIK